MELLSNHPSFTTCQDMHEAISPLRQYGVTYFHYKKNRSNGKQISLGTADNSFKRWLKKEYYKTSFIHGHPNKYHDQIVLASTLPKRQQDMIDDVLRPYGNDHFITIFKSHGDCVENFGFGGRVDNPGIVNFYLNNMDFLMRFIEEFKEKYKRIIKLAEDSPLILPINNESPEANNRLILTETINSNILSKRQLECCHLLVKGKTATQIADTLHLSTRTIEYYISNIRIKLNCKNKAELISKLNQLSIL